MREYYFVITNEKEIVVNYTYTRTYLFLGALPIRSLVRSWGKYEMLWNPHKDEKASCLIVCFLFALTNLLGENMPSDIPKVAFGLYNETLFVFSEGRR